MTAFKDKNVHDYSKALADEYLRTTYAGNKYGWMEAGRKLE
jgi:hypothetical protein